MSRQLAVFVVSMVLEVTCSEVTIYQVIFHSIESLMVLTTKYSIFIFAKFCNETYKRDVKFIALRDILTFKRIF